MDSKTKRVLVYAGWGEPWLSAAAVNRLRELGWRPAFHPDVLESSGDCDNGPGMYLIGEKDFVGEIAKDISSVLSRGHREDPDIIRVFDELGGRNMIESLHSERERECSGDPDILVSLEIPDDVEYEIESYGGWEFIREKSRAWFIGVK